MAKQIERKKLKPIRGLRGRGLPKLVDWKSASVGDLIPQKGNFGTGIISHVREFNQEQQERYGENRRYVDMIYARKRDTFICSYTNGIPIENNCVGAGENVREIYALRSLYKYLTEKKQKQNGKTKTKKY